MEEINLKDLFNYFLSKIVIILVVTVIALELSIVYTSFIKTPLYESYATIVLTRTSDSAVSDGAAITQNDLLINQKLVATYRDIMKSRRVLDQVIENLKLDTTYAKLRDQITVTNEQDTEILRISVSDENSGNAQNIANEIAKVFSHEITEIYSIQNISIIDYARIADAPYNINPVKEALLSALVGFVLSCFGVFMVYYFDTTVKSAEDIENKLNLPVLGVVPKHVHRKGKKGGNK